MHERFCSPNLALHHQLITQLKILLRREKERKRRKVLALPLLGDKDKEYERRNNLSSLDETFILGCKMKTFEL